MSACAFARKTLQLWLSWCSHASLVRPATVNVASPAALKLAAEIDASGGMRGSGGNIMSLGANPGQMGTATYPSSASCLVVYNDGKYVF